ncbi:Uncharacterised protein [Yersinia kristensenii]|nr:Uncharacterised protein [Yersinia kristensenii]
MNFFILPFLYTLHTRLNDKKKVIAWILSFMVPCFFIAYFFILDERSLIVHEYNLASLLEVVLSIIAIYNVYEVGYIYNDAELTKKELNPTIRLNNKETLFYEENKIKIYVSRAIQFFFIIFILSLFNKSLSVSVVITCIAIMVTYAIYNSYRNLINIPLYSLLVWLRYFGICIAFYNITDAVLLWFVYPLCVSIEFSSKPRFGQSLSWIYSNLDLFRVVYYTLLLVISTSIIMYFHMIHNYVWFVILVFYFFIFRFLSYVFLSKRYRA